MEVILRYPCKRDLSHQLAPKAERIVGIGQVGERPEGRIAGAGDHRVDILNLIIILAATLSRPLVHSE